jgi:hypothetical protein
MYVKGLSNEQKLRLYINIYNWNIFTQVFPASTVLNTFEY